MKTALILFTESPVAGEVKRSLTEEQGGIFLPEEARDIYECFLLDTLDVCLKTQCADVFLCYKGEEDALRLSIDKKSATEAVAGFYADTGNSFGRCVCDVTKHVMADHEPQRLLLLAGDLPALQRKTLLSLRSKLDHGDAPGLAVCPSQDGSCSVLALDAPFVSSIDFVQLFEADQEHKPLSKLVDVAAAHRWPLYVDEIVPDIDTMLDLASMLPIFNSLKAAQRFDSSIDVPHRTIAYLETMGIYATAAPAPTDDCLDPHSGQS